MLHYTNDLDTPCHRKLIAIKPLQVGFGGRAIRDSWLLRVGKCMGAGQTTGAMKVWV